jgi:carbon monoxide dehydrogenase subunit G
VKLEKQFDVGVPLERAWTQIADTAALAACVPGGKLSPSPNGERFAGEVTLGSNGSSARCAATVRALDIDDDAHTATVHVQGRLLSAPALGEGTLSARLEPAGQGTRVSLDADLKLTGATAATGALESGGREYLDAFVGELERKINAAPAQAAPAPAAPKQAAAPSRAAAAPSAPAADDSGGSSAGRYAGAGAVALAAAGALLALRGGRRHRTRFSIEYRW